MKKRYLFGVVAAFCMLSALMAGCQYIKGMPYGAFPNSVGRFRLDAYHKDDRSWEKFPLYQAIYKSADGAQVYVEIRLHPTATVQATDDEILKSWADDDRSKATIEGHKLVREFYPGKGGHGTMISWDHDKWGVDVSADDTPTAREFVENLPYK